MSGTEPRISPGARSDIGWFNWTFSRVAGWVGGTSPPHLFLTLGRHRRLFRGWLRFAGRLMPGGRLPRRETELVILRVAHQAGCTYEWDHHVGLSHRAGVTAAEVERLAGDLHAAAWSPREHALLAAADELTATGDLGDRAWEALRRHLDEREAIELVLLAAHYRMLATTIATLRIPPDRHTFDRHRRHRRG